MLARHVSDLTGPSSGAFFLQLHNGWTCRVVRVLPHTKSAHTACKKNAPEDGPVRSETCRANIYDE